MYWFGSNPVFLIVKQLPLLEFLQFILMHTWLHLKLILFEVTNFAPDLYEVIPVFSLDFNNNCFIFKVDRI